ncbi:MAG: ProQ/FINO family protein [Sulfuritalea sp.]|nr:ProQ/FINO family protein [Sulfuritalea sp.]
MTPTPAKSSPRNALLETIGANFAVFRDGRPLALGIHKAIMERMPEVDTAQLRLAMRIHTASTRYLKTLLATRERFDLDGNPAGEVTEEQREVASTTLRERFRKVADRRKAEEQALKEAQREQEAQQKRQEKLAQLAARFNRR